jgi:hypothetical protein
MAEDIQEWQKKNKINQKKVNEFDHDYKKAKGKHERDKQDVFKWLNIRTQ